MSESSTPTPILDTRYPEHQTQDKSRTLDRIISDLWYQYPTGVTTFSKCADRGCRNTARGGALCPECVEDALAELVGPTLASIYAQTVLECVESRRALHATVSEPN